MIEAHIPIRIISVANIRSHWSVKARLTKLHRTTARVHMQGLCSPPKGPMTIVLTRLAPRKLDTDNLASGFKATRDGIADWLGIDDGHPDLDWQYRQRNAGPKVYAVEVEVI